MWCGTQSAQISKEHKNRDWKCATFLRTTRRDIRRANSGDKLVFGVRSKWSPALMYSRSLCGSPCHIGSRYKDNIMSSACNETSGITSERNWLLTLTPCALDQVVHIGLHMWDSSAQVSWEQPGLGLLMHNVPRKRLDLRCSTGTSFPGQKLGLQVHELLERNWVWDSRCTNFQACFCCATALVDFQVPAFCKCETMRDLPLEGSRKLFQHNAMEPQGSALWQVAAGDKST